MGFPVGVQIPLPAPWLLSSGSSVMTATSHCGSTITLILRRIASAWYAAASEKPNFRRGTSYAVEVTRFKGSL